MEILFTIFVGFVIGAIDALPMLLKKMDKASGLSAFVQYVIVTFIVFNTTLPQLGINEFLVGPVVSFLMALPVVVLIAKEERKAVPIVLVNAVVLGLLISVVRHFSVSLFV